MFVMHLCQLYVNVLIAEAKWQPVVIVAVMGAYHVPGVIANWRKSINIEPLTT
jgi:hypothetical protein